MSATKKTAGKTARVAAGAAKLDEVQKARVARRRKSVARWCKRAEEIISSNTISAEAIRQIAMTEGLDPVVLIVNRAIQIEVRERISGEWTRCERELTPERLKTMDESCIADSIASFGCHHQTIYIHDVLSAPGKLKKLMDRFYRRGDFSLEPAIRRAIMFALDEKEVVA